MGVYVTGQSTCHAVMGTNKLSRWVDHRAIDVNGDILTLTVTVELLVWKVFRTQLYCSSTGRSAS